MIPSFKNYGTGTVNDLEASILTTDPDLTILDNRVDVATVLPLQEVKAAEAFRITEDAIKTCPKCKSRQAKRLLSAPSFIRVSHEEITVRPQGPVQVTVELTQRYESNTYRDTVRKRLVMVLEGDAWKILREESSQ